MDCLSGKAPLQTEVIGKQDIRSTRVMYGQHLTLQQEFEDMSYLQWLTKIDRTAFLTIPPDTGLMEGEARGILSGAAYAASPLSRI